MASASWQSMVATPSHQPISVGTEASGNNDVSSQVKILPSLGEIIYDPNGTLESISVLNPKDFWRWYHAPDGSNSKNMGWKWGELWWEYLLTDELVLSGAVPLVLQKKAQMTGVTQDKAIQAAEVRTLQCLRQRLAGKDQASLGGLIMAICGRIQITVQQGEYEASLMHLQAIRKILELHHPSGTEWLCSAWSDLRVVSPLSLPPTLSRFVPEAWQSKRPLSVEVATKCQSLAMQNLRALRNTIGRHFNLLYSVFKLLHTIEALANRSSAQDDPPIEEIYYAVFDTCMLHADIQNANEPSSPFIVDAELIAICLKLCAWESASRCIFRGGEIERALLSKAQQILSNDSRALERSTKGPNSTAILWILFTFTTTAYMFQRDQLQFWIKHLRCVSSASSPSAFKRALRDWPSAAWWWSHAVHRICKELAPSDSRWKVLRTELDPVPVTMTGLRLKLIVIDE